GSGEGDPGCEEEGRPRGWQAAEGRGLSDRSGRRRRRRLRRGVREVVQEERGVDAAIGVRRGDCGSVADHPPTDLRSLSSGLPKARPGGGPPLPCPGERNPGWRSAVVAEAPFLSPGRGRGGSGEARDGEGVIDDAETSNPSHDAW